MFDFFFKYSRATFERGELVFASGWPVWLLLALIVLAGVAVGVGLWRRQPALGLVRVVALGALQTALLAALLVLVWRPALVTQTLRPQENSVAVLLDTSGSMLYGEGDKSRLQIAVDSLEANALPKLKSSFTVNLFSFARDLIELPSLDQVPAPGPVTHIGDALLGLLRGAQSGAIAAVVLVTRRRGQLERARLRQDRGDRELRRARAHGGRRARRRSRTISSSRTCKLPAVGHAGVHGQRAGQHSAQR